MLTLLIGLAYLLRPRPRKPSGDNDALAEGKAPPHLRRWRRYESLGLVAGGLILILMTLASGDERAQALPPAAPVNTAVVEESSSAPPPVQAPTTQTLAKPSDGSVPVTVARSYPFLWPADGPLTSEIGPWHPLGIDIGMDLGVDSPVRSAARGTVTFAGGTAYEDYGYHVIIDHGGGLVTLYGHMSQVVVQEGQAVRQGEYLGLGGATGKAEGKHLHFEVKYNGSQINPLEVLPKLGSGQPEPLQMDCAKEALVIDSGAPAVLDFRPALNAGSRIGGATFEAVNASDQALPSSVSKESDTSVLLDTSPTVRGTGPEDEYALKVAAAGSGSELACTVLVRTRTVRTVFYVRPTSTPAPIVYVATAVPPTSTPTNTPTPTPTPTKTPYPTRR